MAWKKGPLPPNTIWWGGVVPTDCTDKYGFYFADFHGDWVEIIPGGRRLEPHEVAWYDNSLELRNVPKGQAAPASAGRLEE
jgi:hypothetical protein